MNQNSSKGARARRGAGNEPKCKLAREEDWQPCQSHAARGASKCKQRSGQDLHEWKPYDC